MQLVALILNINFNSLLVRFFIVLMLSHGFYINSFAQQKINVIIKEPNVDISSCLYLFGYKYGQLELIDSILIKNQQQSYLLTNKDYEGYGMLSIEKYSYEKGINFILNPLEDNLILELEMIAFTKGYFIFFNSKANNVKQKVLDLKSVYSREFGDLSVIRGSINPINPNASIRRQSLDKKYNVLYAKINAQLDSLNLTLGNDQKYLKKVLLPLSKMATPIGSDNEIDTLISRKEYLQNHFFDFINFSEELIYHDPNLIDAFEFYLSNAITFNEEGYFIAVDKFIELSDTLDIKKKDFIQRFVRNYFSVRNYENVIEYFDSKTNACFFEESVNSKSEIEIQDISLYNQNNESVKLQDVLEEDKLNLVYVGLSWCDACKAKEPKTKELFALLNNFKNVNLINIQVDNFSKNKLEPVYLYVNNLYEASSIEDSFLLPFLKISTTPAYVLVSKNGDIEYKTTNPIKMKEVIFENLGL